MKKKLQNCQISTYLEHKIIQQISQNFTFEMFLHNKTDKSDKQTI